MGFKAPVLKHRFVDSNGDALVGGKLWSYVAGTSTPRATFANRDETPNTNPIILDANGEAEIWLGTGYYKFILMDADDVIQWTVDKVSLPSGAAAAVPEGGTTNQALVKVDNSNNHVTWATINKAFVGLGNVDNTSDATKDAATATLANKTFGNKATFNAEIVGAASNDATTAGADKTLAAPTTLVLNVVNAITSIAGIASVTGVQPVILVNKSGADITVKNLSGSATAGDRIYTGIGADLVLKNNASLWIVRDVAGTVWRVVGGSGSGGGGRTVINHADVSAGNQLSGMTLPGDYTIFVKGSGSDPVILNSTTPIDATNLQKGNRVTICSTSDTAPIVLKGGGNQLIKESTEFEMTLNWGDNVTLQWDGNYFFIVK